jgi:hypothetical protein
MSFLRLGLSISGRVFGLHFSKIQLLIEELETTLFDGLSVYDDIRIVRKS